MGGLTYDKLKETLIGFHESDDRIKSCMIVDEEVEGIIIIPETFKNDVLEIWDEFEKILGKQAEMMKEYGPYGLTHIYYTIADWGVNLYLLELYVVLAVITEKTQWDSELIELDARTRKELIPILNGKVKEQ